jgi:sedoheptulokinase
MLLGIDIGTSKVAAAIVNPAGKALAVRSQAHSAPLAAPAGRAQQDPRVLLESALREIESLPAGLRKQVAAIGVTGQMHGVLLQEAGGMHVTPLITWQDQRCLEDLSFLPDLNAQTGYALCAGFGCATLAWLSAKKAIPAGAAHAATIGDWVAARLGGRAAPVTDPTDAASWGLLDLKRLDWDRTAVRQAGFPVELLPRIQPCGSPCGQLDAALADRLGLRAGIPIATAIGDNQASLLATLRDPRRELALTLGTGGQLSAVLKAGQRPARRRAGFEYRPYPGGRLAAVAASLCGGAAWSWLPETVERWLAELGLPCPPRDDLFEKLDELGLRAKDEITIRPRFLGERHDADARGVISGVRLDNFSLGNVARALARGIMVNIKDMLPTDLLEGRTRMVASGNALRRSALLRKMAQEVFGLPLVLAGGREEAAVGAALNARSLAKIKSASTPLKKAVSCSTGILPVCTTAVPAVVSRCSRCSATGETPVVHTAETAVLHLQRAARRGGRR